MIVRMLVQKVKVTHSGILLHQPQRDSYILTVSRGAKGLKIPAGFARIDADNPLIRFFNEYKAKKVFSVNAIIRDEAKRTLKRKINRDLKQIIKQALYQMDLLDAVISIPIYFREELMGVAFLGKKVNKNKFSLKEIDFFIALASDVAMAIRNARLFKELETELDKKYRLFIHTTVALAAAIDAKDHYTHGHTSRVTSLNLAIAREMGRKSRKVADAKFQEYLHIAGLLHDIGKIGIPESILNKPDALN
jgi:HD-GYP domain-containing protein (c-di-GMP phosphodiesterase class II)